MFSLVSFLNSNLTVEKLLGKLKNNIFMCGSGGGRVVEAIVYITFIEPRLLYMHM